MNTRVEIRHVGTFGEGVGYDASGGTHFVPFGLPGDELDVAIVEEGKSYHKSRIEAVVRPSEARIEPQCRHFLECGGCDWQHWQYSEQLKAKEWILKYGLERARLSVGIVHPIVAAKRTYGYRNRIQLRREGERVGFYRKHSHDLIDIQECSIAMPQLNEALKKLRNEKVSEPQKVELALDEFGMVHSSINEKHAARGFGQVHFEMNAELRRIVSAAIEKSGAKRVLELFCGDGNLTSAYAERVETVLGVDFDKGAIRAGRQRFKGDDRIHFLTRSVDYKLVKELPGGYDLILLDPPRQGVGKVLSKLANTSVKTIVYVSCGIPSFLSDAGLLQKEFALTEIFPLDMFPQTRHLEIVGVFQRVVH